jgi:hypothetical protein
MAKVYLVQEVPIIKYSNNPEEIGKPKLDITPALKYGEIVVISKRLAQMQFSPGPLILEIKEKLKDFNPEEDYVLNYGDPNIIQSVGSILAIRFKKYKTLKWDRRQEAYYTIEMDFTNIS